MRKLKLEIDTLVVESFTASATGSIRGTVDGQSGQTHFDSCDTCASCDGVPTCNQVSCGGTCDAGCDSWLTDCPLC